MAVTTLHYTTLHSTTLHYTTLHYTTLQNTTLHYRTLHYTTEHYTTLNYSVRYARRIIVSQTNKCHLAPQPLLTCSGFQHLMRRSSENKKWKESFLNGITKKIFWQSRILQLYLWHIIYAIIISIELVYEMFFPLFPVHFVNRFHLLNNSEPHIIERMSW